jgi:hypothetical protein
MRGRHERNYVEVDTGYINAGLIDVYVEHEVAHKPYGTLGVIDGGPYSDKWFVIWRPSRRHTHSYKIKVMVDPLSFDRIIDYNSCGEAVGSLDYWKENFVPPERKKRTRPRDTQKNRVYSWESWASMTLSPEEDVVITRWNGSKVRKIYASLEHHREKKYLREFLATVCAELGEELPELKFRTGGRCSYGGRKIRLLPRDCTPRMLLHELAHVLHWRWCDWRNQQAHGKEFVGIYMYLLVRFGGVNYISLMETANKRKVKFLPPTEQGEWSLKEAA